MATLAQVMKLRRKIQDLYDKRNGEQLASDAFAFKDDELLDLLDDASAEASDGTVSADNMSALQEARCMLLARADAILMIAQDEARRIKWQTNNEIVDPTEVAKNLVQVAEALRKRYQDAKNNELKEKISGVVNRPTGGRMDFNNTVSPHSERNFDNQTVRRNRSSDHRI